MVETFRNLSSRKWAAIHFSILFGASFVLSVIVILLNQNLKPLLPIPGWLIGPFTEPILVKFSPAVPVYILLRFDYGREWMESHYRFAGLRFGGYRLAGLWIGGWFSVFEMLGKLRKGEPANEFWLVLFIMHATTGYLIAGTFLDMDKGLKELLVASACAFLLHFSVNAASVLHQIYT